MYLPGFISEPGPEGGGGAGKAPLGDISAEPALLLVS